MESYLERFIKLNPERSAESVYDNECVAYHYKNPPITFCGNAECVECWDQKFVPWYLRVFKQKQTCPCCNSKI